MSKRKYKLVSEQKIGVEARYTNPIVTSTKRSPRWWDATKVFCYSKVVQAGRLATLKPTVEELKTEPWLHCIVLPNSDTIIQYIWDTREIVAAFKSDKVAKAIREMPWAGCVTDAYTGFDDKPLLMNSARLELAMDAMKIAKTWVEPKLSVVLYKRDKDNDYYEFEINLEDKHVGDETYVGQYEYFGKKKQSKIDIDKKLLADIYPLAGRLRGELKQTNRGHMTYDDILDILMAFLTETKLANKR